MTSNTDALSNSTIDQLYESGMRHYRRREWREAAAAFRRIKELDPDRPRIDAILSEVEIFMQLEGVRPDDGDERPSSALPPTAIMAPPVAPRPRADRPGMARRLLFITVFLFALSGVGLVGARALFDQNADQAEVERMANTAGALLATGDYAAAARVCREILALNQDDAWAQGCLQRAELSLKISGLSAEAQQSIDAEAWSEAEATLSEILKLNPNDAAARTSLERVQRQKQIAELYDAGVAFYDDNAWDKARDNFEQIRHLSSTYRAESVNDYLFKAYLNEGRALVNAPKEDFASLTSAVDRFASALAMRPSDTDAQDERRRATTYLDAYTALRTEPVEPQRAINLARVLLAEVPDYANGKLLQLLYDAYLALGDRHLLNKNEVGALNAYDAARLLEVPDPKSAQSKYEALLATIATATPTATPTATATATATPTSTPLPATATPRPQIIRPPVQPTATFRPRPTQPPPAPTRRPATATPPPPPPTLPPALPTDTPVPPPPAVTATAAPIPPTPIPPTAEPGDTEEPEPRPTDRPRPTETPKPPPEPTETPEPPPTQQPATPTPIR